MANKVKTDEVEVQSLNFNPADYPVNPSTREPMKIGYSEFDLGAVRRMAVAELNVEQHETTVVKMNPDGTMTIELS